MSIATEKVKLATERFLLVRIEPARFILPVLDSGSIYEMEFPFPISKIERNGVALTHVNSFSGNDQFIFDETTNTLQVQLASAPNDTSNILIAYYYLFYTATQFRNISQDPTDDTTTVREWKPRILTYPSISQSFENILAGIFTISDTQIDIINADAEFQQYLTPNDSFYNKVVEIWLCINSEANIQKIFTGTITGMNVAQVVNLEVVDSFNRLKQQAFMGDTADEATFRRDASSFPSLDPKQNNKPCPYIVGSSSRYQTAGQTDAVAGGPGAYLLSVGTEAVCTDYSPDVSELTNRIWGCARVKGAVATQSFGAITDTVAPGGVYRFIKFSSLSNVHIGDTFKWNEGGTDYWAVVNYVGSFTYLGDPFNVVISDPASPFSLSSVVAPLKSFGLFIDAPSATQTYTAPRQDRDYAVNELTTSGGNKYISITFEDNFETNFPDLGILNPDQMKLSFRTSNTVVQSHADILVEILTLVGMDIESVSFSDAETDLPVNARFHIPNFDEDSPDLYLKYVQDVLASTLGYLKINEDFEVEYHLLEAPTSNDLRDSFLMLDGATRCRIDYADIVTKIIGFNPHNDSGDAIDDANSPAATSENLKAQYLHGFVNVNRFRHCLEELTTKIEDHINLKSMRRAKYVFETATQDIDTELGDDLQIDNKVILGGSLSDDVKVVTIEKSPAKIRLEALDLKGL